MPTPDPNRKMEDLLRAYARKRREEAGAPFELEPRVRARLRQEVRRILGRTAVAPPPRWGLSLAGWLRLALGGAVAALVVVMYWNFTPKRAATRQFAKAETWESNWRDTTPPPLATAHLAPAPTSPSGLAPAPAMPFAANRDNRPDAAPAIAPMPAPATPVAANPVNRPESASETASATAPAGPVAAPATPPVAAITRPPVAASPAPAQMDAEARRSSGTLAATATNDALALGRARSLEAGSAVAMNGRSGADSNRAIPSESSASVSSNAADGALQSNGPDMAMSANGMSGAGGGAGAVASAGAGNSSGGFGYGGGGGVGGGGGFGAGGGVAVGGADGNALGGPGGGGVGGAGGGRVARGGRGGGRAGRASATPPSQPAADIATSPAPAGAAGASPAPQTSPTPSAAAAYDVVGGFDGTYGAMAGRMEVAKAPPTAPAITNPQSAIRNPQSVFTQQMVRSEPPPAQNALVGGVKAMELPFVVLASFQIERTGQQVRIVDADGSAYEGLVVNPGLLANLQEADKARRQAIGNGGARNAGADALQQGVSNGNFQAQSNGYVNEQANAGELPSNTAAYDIAQYQASSINKDAFSNLAILDQAGVGSGFAFQVSGLNRRLNQNVTVIGSCIAAPVSILAGLNGVYMSNQGQALNGVGGTLGNAQASPAAGPPASQTQNLLDNSNVNYKNTQNGMALQNGVFAGQFWRVTGQVQVGATNRFDLDAATLQP